MNTNISKRTSFLDTGGIERLFSLWETCAAAGRDIQSVSDWKAVQTALQKAGSKIATNYNKEDYSRIEEGIKLFNNMQAVSGEHDFFSCRAAQAELHRIVISDRALEELAKQRVPRTMRNKRPLLIYQTALQSSDHAHVEQQISQFFEDMRVDQKMDIRILEDNSSHGILPDHSKIYEIAKVIWSHVLMETLDAYMYASAIICQADNFITTDSSLRHITQMLSLRSGNYKEVARQIECKLELPSGMRLPKGIRISHKLE